jgi:hypothetical protein
MEFICSNSKCRERLEIADEYAGQNTQCPFCQATVTVPVLPQRRSKRMSRTLAWGFGALGALAVVTAGIILFMKLQVGRHDSDSDADADSVVGNSPEPAYNGTIPDNAPTLHVAWEYPDWSLPFLVAQHRGYFAKRGIKIVAFDISSVARVDGTRVVRLQDHDILNGSSFIPIADESIYMRDKFTPEDVNLLHPLAITKKGAMVKGVVVRKSANIKKWRDFNGKTGIWYSDDLSGGTVIGAALKKEGAKIGGESRYSSGGDPVKGFEEDTTALGLYTWGGEIKALMRRRPNDFALLSVNPEAHYIVNPFFVGGSFVNLKRLGERQELVQKYAEAIDAAIDFIRSDSQGALAIVPTFTRRSPEAASRLSVLHFYKSTDLINLDALREIAGTNVSNYLSPIQRAKRSSAQP